LQQKSSHYTHGCRSSHGIEDVNKNIAEGTTVIEEISREVASVNESVNDILTNNRNIENNANELKQLANELNTIIGRFKY
jgi:methyl-accepting chemotaxis protein